MIYYLPLEPYPERYTELLTRWTEARFAQHRIEFKTILGERLGEGIGVGQVLDAHGRAYWSATQIANLVRALRDGPEPAAIYIDDLFTPGYEAIPYILSQTGASVRVFARNHAQSVDPDDFTWPMRHWMRPFEEMAYASLTGVICASTIHKEMMEIAGLPNASRVHVLGLPYDMLDVRAHVPAADILPLAQRPARVVYASRLDREKQPDFFLAVMHKVHETRPDVEFVLCTGSALPRSNDPEALERLLNYRKLIVASGLSKRDYYRILSSSRVQLNTARQDFISYTAIEASTFGTPTLAPAFRSFPEALENREDQLYAPWSVDEAAAKLLALVDRGEDREAYRRLAAQQHFTLDRIINLLLGAS